MSDDELSSLLETANVKKINPNLFNELASKNIIIKPYENGRYPDTDDWFEHQLPVKEKFRIDDVEYYIALSE